MPLGLAPFGIFFFFFIEGSFPPNEKALVDSSGLGKESNQRLERLVAASGSRTLKGELPLPRYELLLAQEAAMGGAPVNRLLIFRRSDTKQRLAVVRP